MKKNCERMTDKINEILSIYNVSWFLQNLPDSLSLSGFIVLPSNHFNKIPIQFINFITSQPMCLINLFHITFCAFCYSFFLYNNWLCHSSFGLMTLKGRKMSGGNFILTDKVPCFAFSPPIIFPVSALLALVMTMDGKKN